MSSSRPPGLDPASAGHALFVMIAHAWGLLVPLGEFAFRTNLLSALFSASAGGFLFLVVHQSTRGVVEGLPEGSARALRLGGAATAALLGAFTFTNWQNSNETEVYTVATFTTAAMAWAAMLWRSRRHRARRTLPAADRLSRRHLDRQPSARPARGARGPAVPGGHLRHDPAPQAEPMTEARWRCSRESGPCWSAPAWGASDSPRLVPSLPRRRPPTPPSVEQGLCRRGARPRRGRGDALPVPLPALGAASADQRGRPSTLDALLAVIRRAQYPPRTPFDDPTELHGPDNPGRTLALVGWQLANYFQYFDWQWAGLWATAFARS